MDDLEVAADPIFRANKRRKVFRKRGDSDLKKDTQNHDSQDERGNASEEDEPKVATRLQKRSVVKRHGIGFSSTESRRGEQQDNQESALVPFQPDDGEDEVQNDRFVKPTGRVDTTASDKHMMAYVDSKMAEMRTKVVSPSIEPGVSLTTTIAASDTGAEVSMGLDPPGQKGAADRTFQAAQGKSDRIYERPTKQPRRKKKHVRGDEDIARDAYIDQFMQEAQVPIYDRSGALLKTAPDAVSGDNDAATAEAFKAQLLQDMELNRRRPPKSASAAAANVTQGPKLGGSRQQREKMRAIQEAEGKK